MNDKRPASNRRRWLVGVGLVPLLVVLLIFASQLNLTEEPEWLANLTPLEHFLVHVLFFVCGILFGVACAFAAVWAFPKLFMRRADTRRSTSGGPGRL